ncbi:hypothetical protein QR685DRAFT_280573 [Neurospora intermedia]|uniref:Uncharacterized protein n=1 Tax=Neurospora intermedia TaxID=5142 RepID=A0ABR3DF35_NEUIN
MGCSSLLGVTVSLSLAGKVPGVLGAQQLRNFEINRLFDLSLRHSPIPMKKYVHAETSASLMSCNQKRVCRKDPLRMPSPCSCPCPPSSTTGNRPTFTEPGFQCGTELP